MRTLVFHTLVLALAAASASCVDNDAASFFIECNVTPDDSCIYSPGNECLSRGLYNPSLGGGYSIYPRYTNQLRSRGSNAPLRADPNGIHIRGAEVEIQAADGSTLGVGLPNPFSIPTSTFVPSAGGADPSNAGQAVGDLQVIPPNYGAALAGSGASTVLVKVRVFGETNGDVDVETDDYLWPIDLCEGTCLLGCPSADMMGADEECCGFGQDRRCTVTTSDELCDLACGDSAAVICL